MEEPAADVARIISSLKTSLHAMFPDDKELVALNRSTSVPRPMSLEEIRKVLGECTRCPLHQSRTHIVFGAGNPQALLMFVGEGPGEDEDLTGEPFVGRAGQLLTRMIKAISLERDEVYITNIVKCRPPGNRAPLPLEIQTCNPFLLMQIESIRPRIICALGKYATQTLLTTDAPITALRGRFREMNGILVMPTFHPSYLLRQPEAKRQAWEDLQAIQVEYQKVD